MSDDIPQARLEDATDCGYSKEDAIRMWACFKLFDEDGSGTVEEKELRRLMQVVDCDVSENSVRKTMEEIDTDGNGTVSFKEFCNFAKRKQKEKDQRMEKLRSAFSVFDTDGSGYIDREELRNGLSKGKEPLSDKELNNIMDMVDLDKDGKLSVEEFIRLLTMNVQEMIQQSS